MYNNSIPVYIINLKTRLDRKEHILKEFAGRNEFIINFVEACKHKVGAIGLWNSIKKIIQKADIEELEYVLICEDDHEFTEAYSKYSLFNFIADAQIKNADILSGGPSWFEDALQVKNNLFWVERFTGLQFTIFFKKFFKIILNTNFGEHDVADIKLCSLTINKFFIYPFLSTQKEFGYSDTTPKNNVFGRVNELFIKSAASAQTLKDVAVFYKKCNDRNIKEEFYTKISDNITIPTYIIHFTERAERREHIEKQFKGRKEFNIKIVEVVKHEIVSVSMWLSIRKAIKMAIENNDNVIIICKDDHEFTQCYSEEILLKNIFEAHTQGAEILSGGVGRFGLAFPITRSRYWLNSFFCTQFLVLYKDVFQKILNEPFDDNVRVDSILSEITSNKMLLYPFISIQKGFNYSDVIPSNNDVRIVAKWGLNAENRLKSVRQAYLKYFCI